MIFKYINNSHTISLALTIVTPAKQLVYSLTLLFIDFTHFGATHCLQVFQHLREQLRHWSIDDILQTNRISVVHAFREGRLSHFQSVDQLLTVDAMLVHQLVP